MQITKISNLKKELETLNPSNYSINLALKKANTLIFKITHLKMEASHILKQEALASGADFIVSKDMIYSKDEYYDGILIVQENVLPLIINKCSLQPFGLKKLSNLLSNFNHKSTNYPIKIMGIINVTNDSFYEQSRVKQIDNVIERIDQFVKEGADIIDIGGASSRPGSEYIESKEELKNLEEVFALIESINNKHNVEFSIDSYNYNTIEMALKSGINIINDVYGLRDENIINLAREFRSKVILMHNSLITPHVNLVQDISTFFEEKLYKLHGLEVILDPGFGFGKNALENLTIINNLSHFKQFDKQILIGASRKKTLRDICNVETKDALFSTLSLHQEAINNGANILRVHDVKAHVDMIKTLQATRGEQHE